MAIHRTNPKSLFDENDDDVGENVDSGTSHVFSHFAQNLRPDYKLLFSDSKPPKDTMKTNFLLPKILRLNVKSFWKAKKF